MQTEDKFIQVYLNRLQTRWIYVDEFGVKDKITLSTRNNRLETRTCQYWFKDEKGNIKCKIQYHGKVLFVTKDTILED